MSLFSDDTEEADEIAAEEPVTDPIFHHPRAMAFCSGHYGIEQKLLQLYTAGRLPHALIFAGPAGVGKATMAYRFARFLLKNGLKNHGQAGLFGGAAPDPKSFDVPQEDAVFRRVASGSHPDFFSTEKKFDDAKGIYKDTLDVEEIRKIAPFLRMTPSEGGWRIVIADDADCMTRNAQNGILKILEEPPRNSILILVAHRAGVLIPTIRSRAHMVNFSSLDKMTMKELIEKYNHSLSSRDTETIIRLSSGSFGKALEYINGDALGTIETLVKILQDGAAQTPWATIHKFSDLLSSHGNDKSYGVFLEITQWLMREIAIARARGNTLPLYTGDFLKNSSLEQILEICKNLEEYIGRSEAANLDRRQTVLGAFSLLAA